MGLFCGLFHHHCTTGTEYLNTDGLACIRVRSAGQWRIDGGQADWHKPVCCRQKSIFPCLTGSTLDQVGIEIIIQGNAGYGDAWLQALSNDAGFEFRRKTAACTFRSSYA